MFAGTGKIEPDKRFARPWHPSHKTDGFLVLALALLDDVLNRLRGFAEVDSSCIVSGNVAHIVILVKNLCGFHDVRGRGERGVEPLLCVNRCGGFTL